MFEKREKNENTETIIGSGVKLEGTFAASGNITVKGVVSGSIETENDLYVEDGAVIEADVKAKNIFVAGEIKGNLKAQEKIELKKTAKVNGDVECKFLSVEEEAVFNGKCVMGGSQEIQQ